uniref:ABC transporter domain-containing protein n=1 Tax=Clastoptera arizonana TaxID=38151 RepID=A0A1B6DZN6_9HEMI
MEYHRAQALTLEFTDLVFKGQNKKIILNGVNGRFRPGYLCAILGPSGAGKTSLLNILAGFKVAGVTGSILVNGKPRNVTKLRQQSCYITQEFAMLNVLTVRETMEIAACLKLGNTVEKKKKAAVVEEIATVLGLKGSLDQRVAKLSGGEKKRVSIAMELITNPPIMFFDEPTSGLDSCSSLQVMTHLQSLARGGRTIIVVIHQPSSRILELIDDILLISGGQSIYNGPLSELVSTFNSIGVQCPQYYNRADFALEVACHERGDHVDKLAKLTAKTHRERRGDFYMDKITFITSCSDVTTSTERSSMLAMV